MAAAVSVFPAQVKPTPANRGLQGYGQDAQDPGDGGGSQSSLGHVSLVERRKGMKSRSPSSGKALSGDAIPMLRTESRRDSTIHETSSIVGKCRAMVTALRRTGSGRDSSWAMSIRKLPAQSKALVLSSGMVMADPRPRTARDCFPDWSHQLRLRWSRRVVHQAVAVEPIVVGSAFSQHGLAAAESQVDRTSRGEARCS